MTARERCRGIGRNPRPMGCVGLLAVALMAAAMDRTVVGLSMGTTLQGGDSDEDVTDSGFRVQDAANYERQSAMGSAANDAEEPTAAPRDMDNPSEFFRGAFRRPLLQIVHPSNGEVLESTELNVELKVHGYELPSSLHDSRICIGLTAQTEAVAEACFPQSDDMLYNIDGLLPGESYSMRVVIFERGTAVAVSVRSFRVVGVTLNDARDEKPVSIRTALQVAVQHHSTGAHEEAESIYRRILTEHPDQADALHLLGLLFYQRGNAHAAIPYIQHAVNTNSSFEGFHNSLGECLRAVGRSREAVSHFELALSLNENFVAARFNLALATQELGMWTEAIRLYREVRAAIIGRDRGAAGEDEEDEELYELMEDTRNAQAGHEEGGAATSSADSVHTRDDGRAQSKTVAEDAKDIISSLSDGYRQILEEARIRECDILQARGLTMEAKRCWKAGVRQHSDHDLMMNELGNIYLQMGASDLALKWYERALDSGLELAELNIAIALELAGRTDDSVTRFASVLDKTRLAGLPEQHILIRMATVLPRVMPELEELRRVRSRFEQRLEELIMVGPRNIDNSPPLHMAFSLGFHLAYHGEGSNVALKTKLHRVYIQFCPALQHGVFLDESHMMIASQLVPVVGASQTASAQSYPSSAPIGAPTTTVPFASTGGASPTAPTTATAEAAAAATEAAALQGIARRAPGALEEDVAFQAAQSTVPRATDRGAGGPSSASASASSSGSRSAAGSVLSSNSTNPRDWRRIRVGFVSRFFYNHAVGLLARGIISHLRRDRYMVTVLFIDPSEHEDEVTDEIRIAADRHFSLPADLNLCADRLRQERLDIIVYPEIGMEPISYFLAFARLAPVQAVWWGHPDTTGIANVDYFISSDVEAPESEHLYSEKLVLTRGLGAYFYPFKFKDLQQQYPPLAALSPQDNKHAQQTRARIRAQLSLPASLHVYLVPHDLLKFHPSFDDVLLDLLAKDRLAYLLILDGRDRHAWQRLLLRRIRKRISDPSASPRHNLGAGDDSGSTAALSSSGATLSSSSSSSSPSSIADRPRPGASQFTSHRRKLTYPPPSKRGGAPPKASNPGPSHQSPGSPSASASAGGGGTPGVDGSGADPLARVLFYTVKQETEMMDLMQAADVVLDTFPVGEYLSSLQALAIGTPIVTWPSQALSGRFTLAMYRAMGMESDPCCVAQSGADYVSKALKLAHNRAYRTSVVNRIREKAPKLFHQAKALEEWDRILWHLSEDLSESRAVQVPQNPAPPA